MLQLLLLVLQGLQRCLLCWLLHSCCQLYLVLSRTACCASAATLLGQDALATAGVTSLQL
jgi:hypothetical protein